MREIIIKGHTMQNARYGLDNITRIMLKTKTPCKRTRDELYVLDEIKFIIASSYNIDKLLIGRHQTPVISYMRCEDEGFIAETVRELLEKGKE